jgi:heat shock protein HslJ
MSIKGIVVAALLAISLTGQYSCTSELKGPAPTLAEAMEAEYQGIYDSPVRLTAGSYEGEPFTKDSAARPTLRLLGDLRVKGDLDGDGIDESAVLLAENSGGSGAFTYVAVLERRGGGIRNIGTSPLGDRVQVRSLSISHGAISMEVIQHGSGDPMCCPTEKALKRWILEKGSLAELPPVVTGIVSIVDIEGVEWVLESLGPDQPYTGDPPVTIFFGNGKVSGSGGCNRYFAEITEIAPGVIKLGMIGSTRMACGDEITRVEDRFLEAVSGAAGYSFLAGRLALTCRVEDRIVTLIFKAGAPR